MYSLRYKRIKQIDEQPNNVPILGRPLRVRAAAPLRYRRLAWQRTQTNEPVA